MAVDQSQLEAALHAVVDPELGLTLGELGLLRGAHRAGGARRSRSRCPSPPGRAPTSWPMRSTRRRCPWPASKKSSSTSS